MHAAWDKTTVAQENKYFVATINYLCAIDMYKTALQLGSCEAFHSERSVAHIGATYS